MTSSISVSRTVVGPYACSWPGRRSEPAARRGHFVDLQKGF